MAQRVARKEDFKIGTTLITSEGYEFTVTERYDEGIWNARGASGSKCVFEGEAKFYTVVN